MDIIRSIGIQDSFVDEIQLLTIMDNGFQCFECSISVGVPCKGLATWFSYEGDELCRYRGRVTSEWSRRWSFIYLIEPRYDCSSVKVRDFVNAKAFSIRFCDILIPDESICDNSRITEYQRLNTYGFDSRDKLSDGYTKDKAYDLRLTNYGLRLWEPYSQR